VRPERGGEREEVVGGDGSYGACSRRDAAFPSPFPTRAIIAEKQEWLHVNG
jgi:hypothetical protein